MAAAVLIPVAVASAAQLLDLALKIRAEAKRTNEWTPEQEAEFNAKMVADHDSPAWQQIQ